MELQAPTGGSVTSGDPKPETALKDQGGHVRAAARPMPQVMSQRLFFASLMGPLLISAALGVQLALSAVLLINPPERKLASLTEWGTGFYLPDHDVKIFLASVAVALFLAIVLTGVWNRRLKILEPKRSGRFLVASLLLQGGLAIAGTVFFLNRWLAARSYVIRGEEVPGSFVVLFCGLGLLLIGAALVGWPVGGSTSETSRIEELLERTAPGPLPRLKPSALDLLVPLAILVLIYVPSWRQLSGRFFVDESLFHWDFYSMAPTIAFHHGRALGTDAYTMYGVGWPMVFSGLARWIPISYGRMIQVGSLYACLYLTGIYVLLRLLVRRPLLAVVGTGLVMLQSLLGMADIVIWRFPSFTAMRWAFDVWCFIALVMHWRSRRRVWAVVAGCTIGMAILFSTDTGLYLAASVGFYWLCTLIVGTEKGRHLVDVGLSVAAALVVSVTGLLIASRGSLLTAEFWKGWLEPLREFGAGFAQLPVATKPNAFTVVMFAVLFFSYLVVVGFCLAQVIHRRAGHLGLFNGLLALYGLLNLLHFVGRSGDYTTFRLLVPLALIATNLAGNLYCRGDSHLASRSGAHARYRVLRYLSAVVAAVSLVALLASPRWILLDPVLSYPNLASAWLRGAQPDGLCLLLKPQDICGLPARLDGPANQFRVLAGKMSDYRHEGKSFAVVDESGSIFYLAAGSASFSRYPRIFTAMYSDELVDRVEEELLEQAPDFILTRTALEKAPVAYDQWDATSWGMAPDSPHAETWARMTDLIRRNYRLDTEIPPFEIWRLARPASQLQ